MIGSSGEADAAQKLLSCRHSERTALWLRCAGGQQRRALIRVQPLGGDRPAAHALCIEWEDRESFDQRALTRLLSLAGRSIQSVVALQRKALGIREFSPRSASS